MISVSNTDKLTDRTLLGYIPCSVRNVLYNMDLEGLEEIRLRRGLPVKLYINNTSFFVNRRGALQSNSENAVRISKSEIDEALELITKSSVYAVGDELCNGYVTVTGGHRVGICGRAVMTDGKVSFIKDICGLNYRFAHEILGAADEVIGSIYNGGKIRNTLIISPPQCGKTTILRDIARQLSYKNVKTAIVDERGEIAGMNGGISGYELGVNVDVLDFCPKAVGMIMMLRSMSPEVIITDEIGTKNDICAVEKTINSGVGIITSIHADGRNDVLKRKDTAKLAAMFDCYVTLSRRNGAGTIDEIYIKGEPRI